MKCKPLNMAVLGDIHLGAINTTAEEICRGLYAFMDRPETARLDMITLNGDIFDQLLTMPEQAAYVAHDWICDILEYCKRFDIKLRVLAGTPSHDRCQSQWFIELDRKHGIGCDVKYFDTLAIEHLDDFGLDILYIPDELNLDASVTYDQVRNLLHTNGLTKVDIVCMHGAFDYQIQGSSSISRHNPELYLALVRHYIFISHVHGHSVFKLIVAPGSFDRLNHGEERPKGHVEAVIYPGNPVENRVWFIENKLAKKYVTVKLEEVDDFIAALDQVAKAVSELPPGSFVRLRYLRRGKIAGHYDQLRKQFPQFHCTADPQSADDEVDAAPVELDTYTAVAINEQNIVTTVEVELAPGDPDNEIVLTLLRKIVAGG